MLEDQAGRGAVIENATSVVSKLSLGTSDAAIEPIPIWLVHEARASDREVGGSAGRACLWVQPIWGFSSQGARPEALAKMLPPKLWALQG